MPRSKVIDLTDFADGEHAFGPVNLANNVTKVGVEIDRCTTLTPTIWPNASTMVSLRIELSMDGGSTWQYMGSAGGYGGIYVNRNGQEVTESTFRVTIPDGNGRRVRGSLVVQNGPARTSLYAWTDK